MKYLAMRKWILLAAAVLCDAALAVVFVSRPENWVAFAALALTAGVLALFLFCAAHNELKDAKGIMGSAVIRIQPAVLCAESAGEKEEAKRLHERTCIYVSYFGILAGAQVIKFNRDGIKLKAVEIGGDHISFAYGAGADTHNIRMLYSRPADDAVADIVENFRKHTGIIPVLV